MIGYLSINCIMNKIVQLTAICKISSIEIICIDEIKLDSSFSNAQVHLPDCQVRPFRCDRNSSGGGKIV